MSAHTPGPWISSGNDIYSTRNGNAGELLACAYQMDGEPDDRVQMANARLIAAATELLTAVTAEINRCPLCSEGEFCRTPGHDSMRAAIAKAEGRA